MSFRLTSCSTKFSCTTSHYRVKRSKSRLADEFAFYVVSVKGPYDILDSVFEPPAPDEASIVARLARVAVLRVVTHRDWLSPGRTSRALPHSVFDHLRYDDVYLALVAALFLAAALDGDVSSPAYGELAEAIAAGLEPEVLKLAQSEALDLAHAAGCVAT